MLQHDGKHLLVVIQSQPHIMGYAGAADRTEETMTEKQTHWQSWLDWIDWIISLDLPTDTSEIER